MLSLVPPFLIVTAVLYFALIGAYDGQPRDYELSLARQMMQVHNERALEARSNAFSAAADMTVTPGYPVVISNNFQTEIVSDGPSNWVITWPLDASLTQNNIEGITAQIALTNFRTPQRSTVNDFFGAYDALNGRIEDVDIPPTATAIPDLSPVLATRYDPT